MKGAVAIALETPALSTLVSLLKAADLVGTVQNLQNATILAPTNDAFASLPKSVVASLLRPENKKKLQNILLTHVIPQAVVSRDIANDEEVETVSKEILVFHLQMGSVFVSAPNSTARVVIPDIHASRQVVIHIINNVLLP